MADISDEVKQAACLFFTTSTSNNGKPISTALGSTISTGEEPPLPQGLPAKASCPQER